MPPKSLNIHHACWRDSFLVNVFVWVVNGRKRWLCQTGVNSMNGKEKTLLVDYKNGYLISLPLSMAFGGASPSCLWIAFMTCFGQCDPNWCLESECTLGTLWPLLRPRSYKWAWASLLGYERHVVESSPQSQLILCQPLDVWIRPSEAILDHLASAKPTPTKRTPPAIESWTSWISVNHEK